jgi:hypothetical protein
MDRRWKLKLRALGAAALSALLLASCSIVPRTTHSFRVGETDALGRCADFFASLDHASVKARVLDPGEFRIEGFPYLRVNRFLASFSEEAGAAEAFSVWVDRMRALDREARRNEIANLPRAAEFSGLAANDPVDLNAGVSRCGELLSAADFQNGEHRAALRKNALVPDEYLLLWRVLGIYPVARLFVSRGVSNWHTEARGGFTTKPPATWQSTLYFLERESHAADAHLIVSQAKRDALGLPVYSKEAQAALFRAHAPVWEVQRQAEFDRIGAPFWASENALGVDTRNPTTYTLLSFTRFGKKVLTQLNYVIWFPARPKKHALDIYGGFLDGVTYRVTLDEHGQPLLYETVHNCGCYYQAYPTHRLTAREAIDYAEPPLILVAPELDSAQEIMAVAMESQTHYVRHLYPRIRQHPLEGAPYAMADYGELRSLPDGNGGRRSMFGPDSLAPGSERLERFLLWPTGVVSPGAMRQSGRHAVAFVGERHFDDPFALETMFVKPE